MNLLPEKDVSDVEVTNVSLHGFWIFLGGRELFVSFEDFPWFQKAPIGQLLNVQLLHADHLYWPDLDVDLALDSIEHPEKFPLVSRGVRVARAVKVKRSKVLPLTKKR